MDRLGESKLHTTSQLAGRRPRTVMVAVNAGIRRNRNCQTPGLHEITEIIARRSRSCPNEPHPRRHAPTNGGTDNQAHQRPHRTATQVWCGISRQKTPAPNVPVPTPDGSPVRPPGTICSQPWQRGLAVRPRFASSDRWPHPKTSRRARSSAGDAAAPAAVQPGRLPPNRLKTSGGYYPMRPASRWTGLRGPSAEHPRPAGFLEARRFLCGSGSAPGAGPVHRPLTRIGRPSAGTVTRRPRQMALLGRELVVSRGPQWTNYGDLHPRTYPRTAAHHHRKRPFW
ncbi:MAG: hypothetical protein QOJ06_3004 [Pseudonocardiales bacterium]|jgi:hypothetical protein|nr:hypothetical protein [Pseudonocardiales bacterium]